MSTGILSWSFAALLLALGSSPLLAQQRNLALSKAEATPTEHRVALVIGNSAYKEASLRNPVNDAKDVAAKLRTLGFDVIERTNLSVRQIGSTLREFRSKLIPGSVAVVFYAGHGLQIRGENYFPAVDSEIEGEEDVSNQSLTVRQLMEVLDNSRTRLNLVFLDACRNNPYARHFRSASEGLSRVVAPSGTLISFATRPGSVAADGDGRNGLYTQYLLSAMEIPNLPVEQALKRVVAAVKVASKGRQEPWMEGSIEGDFYFLTVAQPVIAPIDIAKLQKEASEQANKEANERLARDRAEMQASMEKMLNEALGRQNALLEAERAARLAAATSPERRPASAPPKAEAAIRPPSMPAEDKPVQLATLPPTRPVTSPSPAPSAAPQVAEAAVQPQTAPAESKPVQLASLPPTRPVTGLTPALAAIGPRLGDEWEYVQTDHLFNKKRLLIERVAAVIEGKGVLEQFLLNGKEVGQWVFDGKPVLLGTSNDIGLLFASHWTVGDLSEILVANWGQCSIMQCTATGKIVGQGTISVPAGTFDATRIELDLRTGSAERGTIVVWYSRLHQRVVKQRSAWSGRGNPGSFTQSMSIYRFDDDIELSAIRYAAR